MKRLIVLLLTLTFTTNVFATGNYSIYLVRHAEKQQEGKNPSLTRCGQLRAKQLASLLSQAKISQIYSTSYQRTMQTAAPLSEKQQIAVQNYNPRYLEQLSIQLQKNKVNSLVVGHSNTTPQLAELLSKQKMAPLTELDYQQLYQVQFVGEEVIVTLLKQPLTCHKN
ncbi:MAG: histidine phosphatase family protein [Colwellia sp.]|nr:histidine phosphatase family protein [Colwellia sp.]MCW8864194.1 histidine phosphatase family protein [Colwellia sp.]MCW9082815.1 histidine phosphatase family protein [Colwellia sp.]